MKAKSKGLIALITAVVLWVLPPILMRYLSSAFDPYSQNFYRYLSSTVFFVPWAVWRRRALFLERRAALKLLAPAAPNVLFQTFMVLALYYIMPMQSTLIIKNSVVFAAFISYIFIPDERRYIRSWRFLAGAALALFSVAAFIVANPDFHWVWTNATLIGTAFSLAGAVCWAAYAATVKTYLAGYDSFDAFAGVVLYTTIALGVLMLALGRPGDILHAGTANVAIVVVSGLLCIGLAHTIYYYAVHQLGVTLCVTLTLLTPFGVGILSWMIFGERLTGAQLFWGAAMIAGATLTVLSRREAAEELGD